MGAEFPTSKRCCWSLVPRKLPGPVAMTPGKGEAVVEVWIWGRSPAQFGWASTGVWCSSPLAGSGGSQDAFLAPIIFSPQQETAVFSSKKEGQPSLLTSQRGCQQPLPAGWEESPPLMGGKSYSQEKPSKRELLSTSKLNPALSCGLLFT